MGTRLSRNRLSAGVVLLLAVTACSSQPAAEVTEPAAPSLQPSAAASGPGTYVGQALNTLEMPVDVRIVIPPDTAVPPIPDAAAAGEVLRRAAAALGTPPPALRYVLVEVDNTGQIDAVPLPDNIDILDEAGRGANFRPAYAVLRNRLELLRGDTDEARAVARDGAALLQELGVRGDLVRPGQTEVVAYVSEDPLADVGSVVVNGSLAVKRA